MFEIVYRYDPRHPCRHHPPADAHDARRRLQEGNRGFAHVLDAMPAGQATVRHVVPFDPRDLGVGEAAGAPPQQRPFAIVLGCSDARVPTELVFNQWCNELFVVRIAGNVLGSEALGSIDYAVHNLGDSVKLLVVLAHSGCGAVTTAVDVFLQPARYLAVATSHPLRAIVDRLVVVVRGAARALEAAWGDGVVRSPGYRGALIETTVVFNAALGAFTLREEFRRSGNGASPTAVFGVYDLASRCVRVPGAPTDGADTFLADPPGTPDDLSAFAARIAGSAYVHALLQTG
ncbi:MAG TPA: carbonic anhydrase [Rhodospirillales bacterium]|nr:carbonic anhydrase [Rhodospirillales bacterium]